MIAHAGKLGLTVNAVRADIVLAVLHNQLPSLLGFDLVGDKIASPQFSQSGVAMHKM